MLYQRYGLRPSSVDEHAELTPLPGTSTETVLARSGLDWTALRPMMLDVSPSSDLAREMKPGDSLLKKVPREALARTVIQALNDRSTIKRPVALVP